MEYVFGYCNSGELQDLCFEHFSDRRDADCDCRRYSKHYRFVTGVCCDMNEYDVAESVKGHGWEYKDGHWAMFDNEHPYGENGAII